MKIFLTLIAIGLAFVAFGMQVVRYFREGAGFDMRPIDGWLCGGMVALILVAQMF